MASVGLTYYDDDLAAARPLQGRAGELLVADDTARARLADIRDRIATDAEAAVATIAERLLNVVTAVDAITAPGDERVHLDPDGRTDGQPVYLGIAPLGSADSAAVWTVTRLTYTGDTLTDLDVRTPIAWDDRATPTPAWET